MPQQRSPQDKKRLSLQKDCRNAIGQADKASRRLIPLHKQQSEQRLRTRVQQQLGSATGPVDVVDADDLQARVAGAHTLAFRKRFRKWPDTPLGEVLQQQTARREKLRESGGRRAAQRRRTTDHPGT